MSRRSLATLSVRFCLIAGSILISAGCATEPEKKLTGTLVSPGGAQRTIVIGPQTRHVNVVGGEVIRFVAGDKEFSWHFSGPGSLRSFRLDKVAPEGILNQEVTAYVEPDPRYLTW